MKTVTQLLCGFVCGLGLLAPVSLNAASPAPPANTPAEASEAALKFLPGSGGTTPLPLLPDNSPMPPWDVTEPCTSVRRQLRAAFDGLAAGQAEIYLALLAPSYQQAGSGNAKQEKIGKEETGRRLREALTRNRCTGVQFGITSATMTGPDTMTLTIFEQMVFLSKNTPNIYITTAQGKTAVISNTSRLTASQIQRQVWGRKGTTWQMQSAEALQASFTAVL